MIKNFEFFFDFTSPYTFIAHKKIRKIEKDRSIKIKYMPILLGALLKNAGIKANVDIPIKGKYMIKDCKLCAEKNNVQFKFNNYFPIMSLNLMRYVLIAEKKNIADKLINKIFDSIWIDDLNLNDEVIVKKLLTKVEINPENFIKESQSIEIKNDLKKRTDNAFSRGVFGCPSFIVNNKLFWGQDRLEFAIEELSK